MNKKILLLPLVTTFFTGCQKDEKTSAIVTKTSQLSNPRSNNLKIGIIGDIFFLDPGKSADTLTDEILAQMYEGLMQRDGQGKIIPNLAESYNISDNGRKYTFHIKKGVKFHNGEEVTAEDFKWTFERNLNKKLNSVQALGRFKNIVGAEAYHKEKSSEIKGIKVLAPYTLEILTESHQSFFLYNLASITACVLNKKTAPTTEITQEKDIIGTGPYKFAERTKNKYIKLQAYQDYHDQKSQVENLEYFIIEENTAMLNKTRKGELDIASISTGDVNIAKKEPFLNEGLQESVSTNFYFLELNYSKDPILINPKVRRAIAHAINQNELVEEALENTAVAIHYLIPKGVLGYRSGKGTLPFDVQKAKKLLNESKVNLNKLNFKITIRAKSPAANKVAENITVQLRKNLGINASVLSLDQGMHHQMGHRKEIVVRYGGSTVKYPDPNSFLPDLFGSKSTYNHTYYGNPVFDQLVKKADMATNLTERALLYQKAEDIVLNDVVVIPLFIPKCFYWINPKVKNARYDDLGFLPYNKVVIE